MIPLSQLNPEWRKNYVDCDKTPDNGGVWDGTYTLTFRCPSCGPGAVVSIRIGPEQVADEKKRTWKAVPMPDGMDWPTRVTITPSINRTGIPHGSRKPTCGFHGSITNGLVQP